MHRIDRILHCTDANEELNERRINTGMEKIAQLLSRGPKNEMIGENEEMNERLETSEVNGKSTGTFGETKEVSYPARESTECLATIEETDERPGTSDGSNGEHFLGIDTSIRPLAGGSDTSSGTIEVFEEEVEGSNTSSREDEKTNSSGKTNKGAATKVGDAASEGDATRETAATSEGAAARKGDATIEGDTTSEGAATKEGDVPSEGEASKEGAAENKKAATNEKTDKEAGTSEETNAEAVSSGECSVPETSSSASKKKLRCDVCKRKVVNPIPCRCVGVYCDEHLHAEKHACTFDYKTMGKEKLREQHPKVEAEKIRKISE